MLEADICVIGAGSAGLSIAVGAARLGAKVILIENAKMGGECLHSGCVPSKALLAAGKLNSKIKHAENFGITAKCTAVDLKAVQDHIQRVIQAIEPHDSIERMESFGIRVIQERAEFTNTRIVQAGKYEIKSTYYVIATGSRPFIPPIPGLEEVPYFTNETIFHNIEKLKHLIIIGGGPIGIEMAQAHHNLGCKVSVLEKFNILPNDDAEASNWIREHLILQGIQIFEQADIKQVLQTKDNHIRVQIGDKFIEGTHLLVATGRHPNIEKLHLEKAAIQTHPKGITVNKGLLTTNPRVYAAGDVVGPYLFTHIASHHASVIIKRIFFSLPAKVEERCIPWVTYCDPELAHVGLTEKKAKAEKIPHKIVKQEFSDIDRAQAERQTKGFIKIVASPSGRILGVTILGHEAGELLMPWILAMRKKLNLSAIADIIVPYPTYSDINKRAAGLFYVDRLSDSKLDSIMRRMLRFKKLYLRVRSWFF